VSYYMRGDYYRGDYYRGDPGLFGAIGKIGGAIGGFLTGGIPGAVAGHKVGGAVGNAITAKPKAGTIALPGGLTLPSLPLSPLGIGGGIVSGVAGLLGFGPGGPAMGAGGVCPKGYHPDKRTKSRCVRNRTMNVLNGRALRRGLRRAEGFEKIARRTVSALRHGPKKFKTAKGRKR